LKTKPGLSYTNLDGYLQKALHHREEEHLLRKLPAQAKALIFVPTITSGLAEEALSSSDGWGGSTGSRLISGNSKQAEATEAFLADFHQAEAALIFNSGYDANVGLFSALGNRHALILYDELVHASIHDGLRLSLAKKIKFRHNDVAHLQQLLTRHQAETVYIAVESVYSMDGDQAPLKALAELAELCGAGLVVDEAHATGVYGEKGEGLVVADGLAHRVYARVHTFGKAIGLQGAVVVGTNVLKNYLINFSRSFIYSTALPPALYSHIQERYLAMNRPELRKRLDNNIVLFRNTFGAAWPDGVRCIEFLAHSIGYYSGERESF
jgi:8-amino-7-oxononanoate synthase